MIKKRKCVVCGKCMGYCTSKRKTCSDKCRKIKSRNKTDSEMTQTKFTTAPWVFGEQNGHCGISINCEEGSQLATVYLGLLKSRVDWGQPTFDLPENNQSVANAHLIAAAPMMYKLLDAIKDYDFPVEFMDDNEFIAFRSINDLLAKARGEV